MPQGFLRVDGIAARVGVLEYLNDDGTIRRELRLPEDVFAPAALAGFEGASITDGHPPEKVTTTNAKQYEVGTVTGPARRDGENVAVSMVVKDPKVIQGLENGDTGLSVGYDVDLDETPGVHPQHGRYDAIQRNIVINHLAARVTPRSGHVARVRMDSVDVLSEISQQQIDHRKRGQESARMADELDNMSPEEQIRFLKTKADDLQVRLDAATGEATKNKERADSVEQKLEVATKTVEEERAKNAAAVAIVEGEEHKKLVARADSAELALSQLKDATPALVNQRAELLVRARTTLGPKCRFDATSPDRAIEEAIIKHLEPTFRADALSDIQIKSRADALYASRMDHAESLTRAAEVLAPAGGKQQPRLDSKEARAKAWRDQAITGGYAAGNNSKEA